MTRMDQLKQIDTDLLADIGEAQLRRNARRVERRNFLTAFGFLAPALLMVSALLLFPVAYNIYLSFTKWKKFRGYDQFAGFSNYTKLASNHAFEDALINTSIWVGASIIFPLAIGFFFALVFRSVRGEETFKSIIFFPKILAPTAVGVIWFYFYAPDGVLNRLISLLTGGDPVDIGWLYQAGTITPAIIVTFVWQTVGLVMVLTLIGLAALPRDPIEAATIDGASNWQIMRHIIVPLLLPTLLVVTILSVLAGFTVFDLLWVMGSGYPGKRSLSLVVMMYFEAFQKSSWAFASAIAVVIGMVVLAITWVQALVQHRIDRMTG